MTHPLCRLLPLALLLAGCALRTPAPEVPEGDIPSAWEGPVSEEAAVWPARDWWNGFGDEELSEVIAEVEDNNLQLANNRRNLRAAQIALREAGFNLLPVPLITIGTETGYSEANTDAGETSGSTGGAVELSAGFNYNDILSRPLAYDQAEAEYDFRVAQAADVALNTLGTTASTYFQLLLVRDKIEAARQNVENAEAIYRIAQARVEAGVAVPIEALQQRIELERERASLRSLEQDDLAARASLALLTGRHVQGFGVDGRTLEAIAVPAVRPGLPAELLRRRPDLVQAEAELRGATAGVDLARFTLLPQISLTGTANAASSSLSELVSSPETLLSINASLVQTVLDNGRRLRNIEQARLNLESALANYRRAALAAFNEVEVLLSNIQLLEQLETVARGNLETAEEAFRIAQVRYEEGVADFQTVLTAQNTLFASRNAYLDNKLLRLNALVGLFQALGGGWEEGGL